MTDELLDEAFVIYEEFGPNRTVPRKERLRDTFPHLAPEEIRFVLEQMQQVADTVWELAERGGETQLGNATVSKTLRTKHSFLHARGLRHAIFLVNYYAWHDGYDKNPAR
jgi:hypothetical protein